SQESLVPIRNGMNVSAACGASPKRHGVGGMTTGLRPRPLPPPPAPATAHAATAYAATATATAPGTSLERMAVLDRFPAPLSTQEIVPAVADDPVVLSICAGLEGGLAAELRATLRAAVDERLVILDLSEVGRIDIAGVGVVIGGIRGMHEHGGRAAIVARPGAGARAARQGGRHSSRPCVHRVRRSPGESAPLRTPAALRHLRQRRVRAAPSEGISTTWPSASNHKT
ncbi:MAG: hypothetical protein QOF20_1733, partial [Acidimicrobiaceae bacterium]|nr:hypothetical protein [Acidimicrobiaceae bacterium]